MHLILMPTLSASARTALVSAIVRARKVVQENEDPLVQVLFRVVGVEGVRFKPSGPSSSSSFPSSG